MTSKHPTYRFVILTLISFLLPCAALAQSQINKIISQITDTIELLLQLAMTAAILVFVYGIVKLIAAAGNPQKITQAKGILWWGVIGIFVMASMMGIVEMIQIYFGVTGGNVTIPQFP